MENYESALSRFNAELHELADSALAVLYEDKPVQHEEAARRAAAIGAQIAAVYDIPENDPAVDMFCKTGTKLVFFFGMEEAGADQQLFDQTVVRFMARYTANEAVPLEAANKADDEANAIILVHREQGQSIEGAAWGYLQQHEQLWYLAALATGRFTAPPQ